MSARGCRRAPRRWAAFCLSGLSPGEVRELYRDEPFAAGQGSLADLIEQLAADAQAGVVVQNSGYEPGVASIAAPIHDMSGRIIAAINISAVALLTSDAELNGPLKADVIATAQAISRDLGHKAAVEAARPPQATSRFKA